MIDEDKSETQKSRPDPDSQFEDDLPGYYTKKNVVFGCGNILFGDDGFGPAVIEHYLANYPVPDDTFLLNIGTSIRNILFDISL